MHFLINDFPLRLPGLGRDRYLIFLFQLFLFSPQLMLANKVRKLQRGRGAFRNSGWQSTFRNAWFPPQPMQNVEMSRHGIFLVGDLLWRQIDFNFSIVALIDIDLSNSWEIFQTNKMVEVGVFWSSPPAYFQITSSINQPFHVRSCHILCIRFTPFRFYFCVKMEISSGLYWQLRRSAEKNLIWSGAVFGW